MIALMKMLQIFTETIRYCWV